MLCNENTLIQPFHSTEFGALEIATINDKPYFPAAECAAILGYKNPQKAIRVHCKGVNELDTPTAKGIQKKKFITEGDLYRLIVRSKLPAAAQFESWVFDEVLPSIRRTGAYKALVPKAALYTRLLEDPSLLSVTRIAMEYGISARKLNAYLESFGVQIRQPNGGWLLSEDYADRDYTVTRAYQAYSGFNYYTLWTQKGRRFIRDELMRHGIISIAETAAISAFNVHVQGVEAWQGV